MCNSILQSNVLLNVMFADELFYFSVCCFSVFQACGVFVKAQHSSREEAGICFLIFSSVVDSCLLIMS